MILDGVWKSISSTWSPDRNLRIDLVDGGEDLSPVASVLKDALDRPISSSSFAWTSDEHTCYISIDNAALMFMRSQGRRRSNSHVLRSLSKAFPPLVLGAAGQRAGGGATIRVFASREVAPMLLSGHLAMRGVNKTAGQTVR